MPAVLALCMAAPLPARSGAADTANANDAALEEIVVHARRRDEKLADAPLAITAISGTDLTDQSAVLIEDALREKFNTSSNWAAVNKQVRVRDLDRRAELDPVAARELADVDHFGPRQLVFNLFDSAFDERLLLARRVVLGVLAEVAVLAGGPNGLDDRRTLYALQMDKLLAQPRCALRCHRVFLHALWGLVLLFREVI